MGRCCIVYKATREFTRRLTRHVRIKILVNACAQATVAPSSSMTMVSRLPCLTRWLPETWEGSLCAEGVNVVWSDRQSNCATWLNNGNVVTLPFHGGRAGGHAPQQKWWCKGKVKSRGRYVVAVGLSRSLVLQTSGTRQD